MAKHLAPHTPKPGLIQRAISAGFLKTLATSITTIKPSDWMSALQPMIPNLPFVFGRQFDFRVGYNTNYTPRSGTALSFWNLRQFAQSEICRLAIETRKDQLAAQPWQIKPKIDSKANPEDPRIKRLTDFFKRPDKQHNWQTWLRPVLEEVFVTDALAIWREPNRAGSLYALRQLDGSTIFPLIDDNGYTPLPPDPAYQQILKGVPKGNYTTDELLYPIHNRRVYSPYGFSAVEQVVMSCKTDLERTTNQLAYFTAGSVPDAYMTMAEDVPPDQIEAFEKKFNSLLAGNYNQKRQVPFVPFGSKLEQTKAPALKDEFDEWIARKICCALSIPPTPFIRQMNRATAENATENALNEGQGPMMLWLETLMTDIIEHDFGITDLEFKFTPAQEHDAKEESDILVAETGAAIITINEARAQKGLDPSTEPAANELMLKTATGYVPLPGSALAQQLADETQQRALDMVAAKPAPPAPGEEGDDTPPPGKDGKKPAKKLAEGQVRLAPVTFPASRDGSCSDHAHKSHRAYPLKDRA